MQAQIIFPKTECPKPAKKDPVYEAFKRRALQLIDKGRRRYGAKRIVEEIRYDTTLQHAPEYADGYKVNNNMTSLYAGGSWKSTLSMTGFSRRGARSMMILSNTK